MATSSVPNLSKEGIILYEEAQLYFTRWGYGEKVLLAFHGFGQDRSHFEALAASFAETHTVYAFDLFFHGQSRWPYKSMPLSKPFWKNMLGEFLKQENISSFGLVGFSMGGKFALASLEAFHERITELILIAPDGVKTSFWYSLATYPQWTKKWFRYVTVKPGAFRQMAKTLLNLKLVDKGLVRFAESQMDTRQKRYRVYFTWNVFKDLKFNLSQLASVINTHHISVYLFLGIYDRVIKRKNMTQLVSKLPDCQVVMLQAGHSRLIDAVAKYYLTKTVQ